MNEADVIKIMQFIADHEIHDSVYWTTDLEFFISCNDFFLWGCADTEDFTVDDLPELERAIKDINLAYGPHLFCARKRKMRPQGACYKHLKKEYWSFFNDAGPEREIDMGNPKKIGK